MVKRVLTSIMAILICLLSGLGCTAQTAQREFFAMDTFNTISVTGKNAEETIATCETELRRIEKELSITSAQGDIVRINHAVGENVIVSDETAALLTRALQLSEETGGAFDPTVYPLVQSWGFFDEEQHVPDGNALKAVLPLVGYQTVCVSGNVVSLPAGAGVDLGGIAKGYATDRLVELLRERGADHAILSFGGNVYAFGEKADGSDWRIAVQDPFSEQGVVGVITLKDAAVVTSGGYQRYFIENGNRYHHILNPKTGYPAESGLTSVTIVCEDATRADALSTALFVMGLDNAIAFWRSEGGFEAVFVDDAGSVFYTENLAFEPFSDGVRINAK